MTFQTLINYIASYISFRKPWTFVLVIVDFAIYLPVEVQKPLRTIDVVERCERSDSSIDAHRMSSQFASSRQENPVRIVAAYKDTVIASNVTEVS